MHLHSVATCAPFSRIFPLFLSSSERRCASCRPSSPTLLYFSALFSSFPSLFPTSPSESPLPTNPKSSALLPHTVNGQKRPNTGTGLSTDCTLLKTTTWQWASHRRFQRKANISFQNGAQRRLRVPAQCFFCFLSLFFPWVFFAEPL